MPDAFDSLRAPIQLIDPDQGFARRLRARLERALSQTQGVVMENLTASGTRIREGDIGYVSLWVHDLIKAEAFYRSVLGWSTASGSSDQGRYIERVQPGQGLASISGGRDYLREAGLTASLDAPTLFLCYAVDDVEAAVDRVRAGGGQAAAPKHQPYGYIADCVDDQGTAFALYEPVAGDDQRPAVNGTNQGDVSYITMHVVDSARARAFYGSVLGWRFEPGRIQDGWQVLDTAPMIGLAGGSSEAVTLPMYRVDDAHAAVERVRAGGGTATEPTHESYGWLSECTDNQGTRFYLGQH
jgi:predicted enzyme related to lactoylglutathione lyase